MLRVPLQQAQAGMVLARSIPNPQQTQQNLLKAGFELDGETLERLRQLKVRCAWVNYPDLDFLDELLDPDLIRQQQDLYGTLKEQFNENQEWSLAKLDYSCYVSQMANLFSRLLSTTNKSVLFVQELQSEGEDLFLHGTTVAGLALLIGMRLEGYLVHERPRLSSHLASDLTYLGVGCLLHDIGKLSLPEELRHFHLTAQDRGSPQWQKHTEAGFEMLQGGLDPSAAQVVLNHHQHFDGSGFPGRKPMPGVIDTLMPLAGHDLHVFCRIAAVADRFDGFRHLPDGSLAPTIVALKRMQNPGYAKWFDPVVLEAFLQTVPPFAPGEQVTLNNGQLVVVTEVNEQAPCRPMVRPLDPAMVGKEVHPSDTLQTPDINLMIQPHLQIKRVGDFDVSSYLY